MTDARHAPPLSEVEAAAALSVFRDGLDRAVAYAELLCGTGVEHGLVGPREVERIWSRHLLNCAVVETLLPPQARVADVGSGAGLPGLALAIARPDIVVTLIEPLLRRTAWLEAAVEALGLGTVTVVRARAEEVSAGAGFDVVTSRAVAALPRLGRWCLPLVATAGSMVAIKGRSATEELAGAEPTLRSLGASRCEVLTLGEGLLTEPTTVVRLITGERPRHQPGQGKARRARRA